MENEEWRMDCHERLGSQLHGCVIFAMGLEWTFSTGGGPDLFLFRCGGQCNLTQGGVNDAA
jgi:hypothetical protein